MKRALCFLRRTLSEASPCLCFLIRAFKRTDHIKVHVNMKRQKKSEERRGVKMFQASKLERSTLLGGYRGRVVGIYVGSCNYKIKNSKSILSLKKVQSKIEVQKVFILLVVV
ncbi:uncharacterized protein LOC132635874 isoform X2 [Lycium barbarum]|nr:uncharacterized protein LOC132635874 isoform X2 [Lycium barbarum]XP_060208442.1 uncharacterized protein LOC132635874 isoform X2 [Lycium barbarum]XP_060208443.1 uncharacterized protein LOC132635874 isoform X2 [Lycium barbarum]